MRNRSKCLLASALLAVASIAFTAAATGGGTTTVEYVRLLSNSRVDVEFVGPVSGNCDPYIVSIDTSYVSGERREQILDLIHAAKLSGNQVEVWTGSACANGKASLDWISLKRR